MTAVIENDYVITCLRYAIWLVLSIVLFTFWQIIRCSVQTKTKKKCVQCY